MSRIDGSDPNKELTLIERALREGTVDLSYLSAPPADAQIDAMVEVTIAHTWNTNSPGNCDCGWSNPYSPADFKKFQRATLRHIMEDIVARVFSK